MGFSLKKTVKKIGGGATNLLEGVLTGRPAGQIPGTQNPFSPPNIDFLNQMPQQYLNTINGYEKEFGYLKKPRDLTQGFSSGTAGRFNNYYSPPTDTSEGLFNDLVRGIDAPSSVDQALSATENDRLKQTLAGIDQDTKQNAGSLKLDFQERGLGGPTQMSDIESSGLGGVYSDAARTKAGARTSLAMADLDRQKQRETALREAYGARYQGGLERDTQGRDIAARGAMSDQSLYGDLLKSTAEMNQKGDLSYADILNRRQTGAAEAQNQRDIERARIMADLYTGAASNQRQGYVPPQNSAIEDILRNIQLNFGK